MYSKKEAIESSIKYFNGDELAADVFVKKYALTDKDGNLLEKTPDQMHRRIAKEFARIEKSKFKIPLLEEEIFNYLDHFNFIVPAGSPMFGIGNDNQTISLSNCFFLEIPEDSYSSILKVDEQIVNVCKRRGGVGVCLDKLRPSGVQTHNAAKTSTGIIPFMERYSNSIREVGQGNRRGAGICLLSVHHPQIIDFINVKRDLQKVTGMNISGLDVDDKRA
jgi:ribonucleoside-diphosphate reductase alpha chain